MNELDKLRPAAREAILVLTSHFSGMHGIHLRGEWKTIRAELLRLAEENEALHSANGLLRERIEVAQRIQGKSGNTCRMYAKRAERAEAELAALKARIAEAPVVRVERHPAGAVTVFVPTHLASQRVRLLLDDGESA